MSEKTYCEEGRNRRERKGKERRERRRREMKKTQKMMYVRADSGDLYLLCWGGGAK